MLGVRACYNESGRYEGVLENLPNGLHDRFESGGING